MKIFESDPRILFQPGQKYRLFKRMIHITLTINLGEIPSTSQQTVTRQFLRLSHRGCLQKQAEKDIFDLMIGG